jgi:hypothetical protein
MNVHRRPARPEDVMFAVFLIFTLSVLVSALLGALIDRPDHPVVRLGQAD